MVEFCLFCNTFSNAHSHQSKPSTVHDHTRKKNQLNAFCVVTKEFRVWNVVRMTVEQAGKILSIYTSLHEDKTHSNLCALHHSSKNKHKQSMLKILWTKNEFKNRMQQKKTYAVVMVAVIIR